MLQRVTFTCVGITIVRCLSSLNICAKLNEIGNMNVTPGYASQYLCVAVWLQCVAVCCSALYSVAVRCSALQGVAGCYKCVEAGYWKHEPDARVCQPIPVCCSVLQCVAVCCSALQCVAVRCSALQCVAVCCSMLQCVSLC